MEKYKVQVTIELLKDSKTSDTSFASTILKKIEQEKLEKERILFNNKEIENAMREIALPLAKEIALEIAPLGLKVTGGRTYANLGKVIVSYDFATTSDSNCNFMIQTDHDTKRVLGETMYVYTTNNMKIVYSTQGRIYPFTNTQELLKTCSPQIEEAYRIGEIQKERARNQNELSRTF